jgi:hypothetical protein
MPERGSQSWLLIIASAAGARSSLRVAIWRKLRSLGALYLQQSVCLLPERPKIVREIDHLVDRVRAEGGSARVLSIRINDRAEEAEIIAALSAARDEEYDEVLERLPSFLEEISMERARGRATYEEVEESEADLQRFRAWLEKIDRRDYFHAPRRDEAHAGVARCQRAFEDFEAEAFARDERHAADGERDDEAALRAADDS